MKKNQIVADRLSARRDRLGLTQREMAEFLGVSLRTISAWELGENYPHATQLRLIAQKLQVSIDWLIGDDQTEIESPAREMLSTSPAGPRPFREPCGVYSANLEHQPAAPEIPTPELCLKHLEALLQRCARDPAKIGWVLMQLKKHLPVDFFDNN